MKAALLLVLASGFLHAYWNYLAKRSLHKHAFLWHAQWVAIAVFTPFAVLELIHAGWAIESTPYALGSMLLHGVYIWLLAQAYRMSDLSQVYPILRGTAPLLVPIIGVFVLGEFIGLGGWCGIALVVIGIVCLSGFGRKGCQRKGQRYASGHSVGLALLIGIVISGYIFWDKIAISRGIPPVTLNVLSNYGNWIALTTSALRSKAWREEWRVNRGRLLVAGAAASGGYTLFLLAMPMLPIAKLAPMREIGTVFGTVFGIWLLGEPAGKLRIAASVLITVGIILLSASQ